MKSFVTIANALILLWVGASVNTGKSKGETHLDPPTTDRPTGPSKIFPHKKYEEYQISDGPLVNGHKSFKAGTALADAEAVFDAPFKGVNARDLTETDLNNLYDMAGVAIFREAEFVEAIKKAGADTALGKALQRGMIANKVLKIKGRLKVLDIQTARGLNPPQLEESLRDLKPKLDRNTKTDQGNKGLGMVSYLSIKEFKPDPSTQLDGKDDKSKKKKKGHHGSRRI